MIGWILFADAVAHLVKKHGIAEREAGRQIVTAARHGTIYTQGRIYHDRGQPFVIAPVAWDGMDPYPALSMLCTPNPGTTVQEPFLGAPKVVSVEIHAGSLEAWAAGQPKPPAPFIERPVPDELRASPLVWRELHRPASEYLDAANHPPTETIKKESQDVEAASPQTLRPRGAPPIKKQTILSEMRKMDPAELAGMKEEAMSALFGAARSTCRDYRREVLAEIGGK
jgi:hypothetical protein